VAAIFLVLLLSAIMTVWLLFDPNDYKDNFSLLVEERTGRSFIIEGDLELTFFPWLGVRTGIIRVGNAENFGEEDFASIATATVRVRLLPLLSKRLEIGTVELDGLELNLSRNDEGRGNWEDLIRSAAANGRETQSTESVDFVTQGINIAGINIRDGIIFWRENFTEVHYVLSELSLDTGPITSGQPVDAALEFQLVSVDPALIAQLNARATVRVDSDVPLYAAESLELEFRVEDGQHDERMTGQLEASVVYSGADSLLQADAVLFEAELTDPPLGPEELDFRASSQQARFDIGAQTIEMDELTTTIGNIVARWEFAGSNLLSDPQFTGIVSVTEAPVEDALNAMGLDTDAAGNLGVFDLASLFTVEPTTGNMALTEVRGSALDIQFTGEITVNERETVGRIETDAFNPTTLIEILPQVITESADLSSIDTLALGADFNVNGSNRVFSLRNVTVTIPGATVTGAVDRLEDGRRLRGRIASTNVTPDVLLTLFPNRLPEGLGPDRLGAVSINTSFDYDAADDSLQLDDLNARALGLQTMGSVVVRELSSSLHLIGDIEVQRFSPRALLDRFDQPVPVTSDDIVLGAATISATVDINEDRGQFSEIRMRLDDTFITGQFAIANFNDPKYVFDLAMDQLNIDRYLAPADREATTDDLLLPTDSLRSFTLEGQVSIADLKIARLNFSNVSTNVSIENNVGQIDSALGQLYGGKFEGGLELDARIGRPLLSLHGSGVDISLGPLMTSLLNQPTLSGTGTFDLEISGAGESLNDVLTVAEGHIDFSLLDGAMHGFNLDHTLCDTYNRLQQYPRPAPTDDQFTKFNLLRGTTRLSDGIARTSSLVIDTPSLEITGQGQMDLFSQKINYGLEAEMTNEISISQCGTLDRVVGDSIPLEVSGTATEPQIQPDISELVQRELRDLIQDRIQDRLLEGLFGN
jgi:uncharacterized protein involved in outer membrane biogenesis